MSSSGTLPIKDSTFGSGHHKKPKRRRNRNKFRTSNLRKKRTKKFYSVKKVNYFKPDEPNCNLSSQKSMSNWYWSNYKKAVEWQDRHKIAHWKACALALLEENRYLLQIINEMQPGMIPEVPVTQLNLRGGHRTGLNQTSQYYTNVPGGVAFDGDEDEGDDNEDEGAEDEEKADDNEDDIEFEMSEEMIQFFEQSYRHKMDLKKLKEKELLNKAEEEVKQMQSNKIKRSTEMNLLYGDGASMIIGMETAVQLSFDKYCDTKSPKYWPNIPLRL